MDDQSLFNAVKEELIWILQTSFEDLLKDAR